MAIILGNRAKMSTSTTGTGTITLGSALSGYQTFAQAGITNGQTVRYTIEDGAGFEIGSGVYTSSGTTLTRSVAESSNSDNAISLSGSAEVFITASAADIFVNDGASTLTTTGVITGGTVEATSDTAAGDNAAMGYQSDDGLVLTGQGAVRDVTIKNDADATVISIPTGTTNVDFASSIDVANVAISTGVIDLKNSGSQSVVKFYCESSNAHYAEIKAPAHGAFSGNVTLTLPATTDTIAGIAATQTFTNKTLTAPKIADGGFIADANGNELVVFQTTGSAVNQLEITNNASGSNPILAATGGDTNIGIALTPKGTGEIVIAAGDLNYGGTAVTTTGAEINLIDGDTSRGTTAVASGDGILINDAGTMRMTNVDTVSTYFSSHSVGGGNIVTTGALNSGSITSGFGAIDNGSSNITTTGVGTFASLDISGDIDVDGTTNLDAVDIDGAVQLDATLTVGVDDTGYDVKFFGDTASAFMQWDASADDLILGGAAGLIVPEGQLTIASTAMTSSAADLNQLDGKVAKTTGLETIWVPATAMYPATTNGSSALTQVETTALRPDLMVLDFAAAADDFAQFSIAFPKSWNEGTVKFQVFWTPSNTNQDNCIWSLQGVSVADGATIDVAYGTAVSVTDAGIGTVEDQQVSPVSGDVTITNAAVDTQTYFQIFRDANAGTDTFSGVARLLGVKIFFTTDAANDA